MRFRSQNSGPVYARGAAGRPQTRLFMRSIGLAGVIAAAVVLYVGYQAPNTLPGQSYYHLNARFADAQNLANHYEVRIGGERAGQVLDPHTVDGQGQVDLQLDSKFKPLLSDSRLAIRLRSAVGVRYVEIIPGTHGTPLADGATITADHAIPAVALDEVLGTFDGPARLHAQQFLRELGNGLAGRGEDAASAIQTAPSFLGHFASVSSAITARPQAMRNLIIGAHASGAAFDPVRQTIADGFQPESQAVHPIVARSADVHATFEQAPGALDTLSSDLPAVSGLVSDLDGLAREGHPTLGALPVALTATSGLLSDARPALRHASRTLDLARQALDPTLTFLRAAQPALPDLNRSFADLTPTVKVVRAQACDITNAMFGWSEFLKWGTDYNNFIRFNIIPLGQPLAGNAQNPVNPLTHVTAGQLNNPYPEPCSADGTGESGPPPITAEESAKGLTYSATHGEQG